LFVGGGLFVGGLFVGGLFVGGLMPFFNIYVICVCMRIVVFCLFSSPCVLCTQCCQLSIYLYCPFCVV
jgi:hypothetical protein